MPGVSFPLRRSPLDRSAQITQSLIRMIITCLNRLLKGISQIRRFFCVSAMHFLELVCTSFEDLHFRKISSVKPVVYAALLRFIFPDPTLVDLRLKLGWLWYLADGK